MFPKKIVAGVIFAFVVTLITIGLKPVSFPPVSNSAEREALISMKNLGIAVELYRSEFNKQLPEEQGLRHLSDPKIELIKHVPTDPWGEPYKYSQLTDSSFIIWSSGSKEHTGATLYEVFDLPVAVEPENGS